MSKFISEALRDFLESHTQLNNYSKVATAAVDFLHNSTKNPEELSSRISELILSAGERWTPKVVSNPHGYLQIVRNDIAKSAIIWVYSAFDVFFKEVEGQLSGYFPKVENEKKKCEPKEDEENKASTVIKLYQKLNWNTSEIAPILPVFRFYKELRNCVAHNIGLPSVKLLEIYNSDEFKDAIKGWQTKFPKKTISAPPIVDDQKIELKPHHAILYSECCRRIAEDITGMQFNLIKIGLFIKKIIKRHLYDAKELSQPLCRNYTQYIMVNLKNDYGLSAKYEEISEAYADVKSRKNDTNKYEAMKKKQLSKPTQ